MHRTRFAGVALLAMLAAPAAGPAADSLAGRALIRRDRFGVPHILADSDEAVAFGLGYAQAEDHALPLLRRFVAARGEAAKYFREQGKEDDFLMKWADNAGEAQRALAELSPEYRKVIRAFAE